MGLTFTALLVKKTEANQTKAKAHFKKIMGQLGYESVVQPQKENTADLLIRQYHLKDRDWMLFLGAEHLFHEMDKQAAKAFQSEILVVDCVDSDYLEYTLHKTNKDVTVGCYDLEGTGLTFVEDLLPQLGEKLGYDLGDRAVVLLDAVCEQIQPDETYYFSKPEPSIEETAPKLEWAGHHGAPLRPGISYEAMFKNMGGAGKGVQVQLSGPFVETDAMTFSDVKIIAPDGEVLEGQYIGKFEGQNYYRYVYNFPDLEIKPFKKGTLGDWYRLLLTPHGDARYGLDFYYTIVPLDKGTGFRETNCGVNYHKEFIEEWNEHSLEKLRLEDFEY